MTLPDPRKANPSPQQQRTRQTAKKSPIAQEIKEDERYDLDGLPEPASYGAVLVALSKLDPLAQEVMLAQRLASMPSQHDGSMPVNIPRMVRGPWAHHLRKLGIFCIPELATHELVTPETGGAMANHTAMKLKQITPDDMWEVAKSHNPDLASLVENAKTPEEKKKAMLLLAAKLPVDQRIALEKLSSLQDSPEQT